MSIGKTPDSYSESLMQAVDYEVGTILSRRNAHEDHLPDYGRFMLSHFLEGADAIEGGADIDEIANDMLSLLGKDPNEKIHDGSTERFESWEVTGWKTGTTLLLKNDIILPKSRDEFFSFVSNKLLEMTPSDDDAPTTSVNESMSNAAESADASIMLSVDQIRDLFDDEVGSDSVVDVDAFKRGLYFAFTLGQEFIDSQLESIDEELENILASEI